MKRIYKLATLSTLLMLSSCTTMVKSLIKVNDDSIVHTYSMFNGDYYHGIKLLIDSAIEIEVTTVSGSLSIDITNRDSKISIYSGNISEDFKFEVNATKGSYQITLNAKNHTGSYSFKWNLE